MRSGGVRSEGRKYERVDVSETTTGFVVSFLIHTSRAEAELALLCLNGIEH